MDDKKGKKGGVDKAQCTSLTGDKDRINFKKEEFKNLFSNSSF